MNLLFLLASIGVLNGFVVSMYMLFKRERSFSELYFGGLLFALSIRIGKSILYFFNRETDLLVLQIGLSFCVFIGPLFYLFLVHKLDAERKYQAFELWFLMSLAVAIVAIGIIYPYRFNPQTWNGVIIYFIYGTWLLFTLLGIGVVGRNWRKVIDRSSKVDLFYLGAILVAYLFITLTYQLALFTGIFYIWGSLIFTLSFYILFGRLLTRKKEVLPRLESQPLENGQDLMNQLKSLMEDKKPYLNPQLKLEDLARTMELSKHQLSRLLNEIYPYGFSQFVKEYRVAEAKYLIEHHPEWSLDGVGFEAGFSSRSSFFEAFKKVESMTPAMFRKSLLAETSPE